MKNIIKYIIPVCIVFSLYGYVNAQDEITPDRKKALYRSNHQWAHLGA